jgi:mRNA interferase RelE/StbE
MRLNENWQLVVRDKVYKKLTKLPKSDRDKIMNTIEKLPLNPFYGDIEKMKGEENSWRKRVGSYRIFYEIIDEDRTVYVYDIKRRTSKTY